jgi:MFS family permease
MISPFVGTLIDRFGPRKVMMFGVIITGTAFMLLSQVQNLWQFYLAIVLLTFGMSFGTFIVLVVTVSNWFVRRRARALGILMSTSALGGFAVPLLNLSVESFGWRDVMFAAGVGFLIVGIPSAMLMRRKPEDYGVLPDGDVPVTADEARAAGARPLARRVRAPREASITARDSMKMRFFWQLAIASSLGQFVNASNLTHLEALKTYGVNGNTAAIAIGLVAIGDLTGRVSIAAFGDRVDKRWLLASAFAIETLGIFAIAIVNAEIFGVSIGLGPVAVYTIAFGLGFGASVPIRLALLADYFGRRSYGSIVGLTSSVNAAFGAFGAAFAGFMFDITDSYRIPFLVMTGMLVIAVPLTLTLESRGRVAARTRQALRRKAPPVAASTPAGGQK